MGGVAPVGEGSVASFLVGERRMIGRCRLWIFSGRRFRIAGFGRQVAFVDQPTHVGQRIVRLQNQVPVVVQEVGDVNAVILLDTEVVAVVSVGDDLGRGEFDLCLAALRVPDVRGEIAGGRFGARLVAVRVEGEGGTSGGRFAIDGAVGRIIDTRGDGGVFVLEGTVADGIVSEGMSPGVGTGAVFGEELPRAVVGPGGAVSIGIDDRQTVADIVVGVLEVGDLGVIRLETGDLRHTPRIIVGQRGPRAGVQSVEACSTGLVFIAMKKTHTSNPSNRHSLRRS